MRTFLSTTSQFFKSFPVSLAVILLAITVLRIPTFFEPYWYGDEGIYLVIGTALNRGAHLYTDIVDHKTPLIYYLARVSTQLEFRVLLYFWMIAATSAFFFIAKHFFKSQKPVWLATALFALFTTVPWMEGNIANGELFVMGFVLVGLWLVSRTKYFLALNNEKYFNSYTFTKNEFLSIFGCGLLLGLAILTKVPALFDTLAIISISYFLFLNYGLKKLSDIKNIFKSLRKVIIPIITLALGMFAPILLSVLYFFSIGSGQDYLDFGLLYNFKYAGSWQLGFTNPVLIFFFTLQGKAVFLILVFLAISLCKKVLSPLNQFLFGWFALALIASLLSNRPYPHYFLQALPPLALIISLGLTQKWKLIKNKNYRSSTIVTILFSGFSTVVFISVLLLMKVGFYPTLPYYKNFISFATGSLPRQEYYQTFNYLMNENYKVASLIRSESPDKIFIWGTNPMLYALSGTRPASRFTVAFHIEDLGVQDETMNQVRKELPMYIVVMRDQPSQLPGLDNFLDSYYIPVETTDHMIVWRKLSHKRV